MSKKLFSLVAVLTMLSLLLAACQGEPEVVTEVVEQTKVVKETEVVEVTPEPTEPPEKTQIRWFIGLGTGTNPEQVPVEELFVESINNKYDDIELVVEIVPNDVAFDTLKTQISSGDPPDIVGPVGVRGSNEFKGMWMDLEPLLEDYDLSGFSEGALEGWQMGDQGMIGLAIGVYPSAIFFNKALFDEAGLDYPPQEYGEPYADGDEWNVEKLEEIGKQLTVDANGNDATSDSFDPDDVVQFGFDFQWTDPRGWATMFGAGNFVDDEGNAYMPDHWAEAFRWTYEAKWPAEDGVVFMPNGPYINSDMLGNGNPFNSGNVAMSHCHTWYTCCLADVGENWDLAAIPSYEGEVTAKLHTDMVGILRQSEHPDKAARVLYDIATSSQLIEVWGAVPAVEGMQEEFFASLDEQFPQGVNWDVALAGLDYVDVPNHEAYMPNFAQADDRVKEFQSTVNDTADLDVEAAMDQLISDLQSIFEAAEE